MKACSELVSMAVPVIVNINSPSRMAGFSYNNFPTPSVGKAFTFGSITFLSFPEFTLHVCKNHL